MGSRWRDLARVGARVALVWGLLAAQPSRAAADPTPAGVAAARASAVRSLEELASWAQEKRLLLFRQRVLQQILVWAPDHGKARAALKHRKDPKSKTWVEPPAGKPPLDHRPDLLPEAQARLTAVFEAYRESVIDILADDDALPEATRLAHYTELLGLLPQDPRIHQFLGDLEEEGKWWTRETVGARKRRAHLKEIVRRARAEAEERTVALSELPPGFQGHGFRLGDRRVYGTADDRWARETIGFLHVGGRLVREGLELIPTPEGGTRQDLPDPQHPKETYLFPDAAAAKAWMAANPSRTDDEDLRSVEQVGGCLTEDVTCLVYFDREAYRRTGALRQLVSIGVYLAVRDVCCPDDKQDVPDWVNEGFTTRLCLYVTSLRLPGSVTLEDTQIGGPDGEEPPLPPTVREWLPASGRLLAQNGAARLRRLLTVRTNAMRPSDVILAHALAAYLLEGRDYDLKGFLKACCTYSDPDAMVREGLEMEVEVLVHHLRRWVVEQDGP